MLFIIIFSCCITISVCVFSDPHHQNSPNDVTCRMKAIHFETTKYFYSTKLVGGELKFSPNCSNCNLLADMKWNPLKISPSEHTALVCSENCFILGLGLVFSSLFICYVMDYITSRRIVGRIVLVHIFELHFSTIIKPVDFCHCHNPLTS
jgi:hypothetical protein